ncbi:Rieske 2Fe-2S domain-containing protein [Streptacidiphilus monticola]
MSESVSVPAEGACCASRRSVLRGAAAVGVVGTAGVALAACGSSGGAKKASGPVELGPTSDVPVGGGKVYRSAQIVVTQPTAGQFKGFSAICTHAGCVVDGVKDGAISCPCHGSTFNASTGAVTGGPAPPGCPPSR